MLWRYKLSHFLGLRFFSNEKYALVCQMVWYSFKNYIKTYLFMLKLVHTKWILFSINELKFSFYSENISANYKLKNILFASHPFILAKNKDCFKKSYLKSFQTKKKTWPFSASFQRLTSAKITFQAKTTFSLNDLRIILYLLEKFMKPNLLWQSKETNYTLAQKMYPRLPNNRTKLILVSFSINNLISKTSFTTLNLWI